MNDHVMCLLELLLVEIIYLLESKLFFLGNCDGDLL